MSMVWLREQIMLGGGPDWLDRDQPQQPAPQEEIVQENLQHPEQANDIEERNNNDNTNNNLNNNNYGDDHNNNINNDNNNNNNINNNPEVRSFCQHTKLEV